jgi:proteasome-associated ATPase
MAGSSRDRGAYEDRESLIAQIGALKDELDRLRDRVTSHPHDIAMLERRLADARSDARTAAANNERLAATLREARDQIVSLKSEVDRLAQPPATFAVFLAGHEDNTADIYTSGRKMILRH